MTQPPHSTVVQDAELGLLGCLLIDGAHAGLPAVSALSPEDFAHQGAGLVFRAMRALYTEGAHIDPFTLSNHLELHGDLETAGGKDFIAELIDVVPTDAGVVEYARIILDAAQRRALARAARELGELAHTSPLTPVDLARYAQTRLSLFERAVGGASRFGLFDAGELAALPRPSWLIDGVLPSQALAVVIAAPKSLKTFLALDWCCHIVLGLDWHNRRVRRGPVVYVYAEGAIGAQQRLHAWQRFHGVDELPDLYVLPRRVGLNAGGEAAQLLAEIQRRVQPAPVLIVIDTVARNMDGNENATEDMSAFVRGCDRLRDGTGAAVVAVHHKGTAADDRGRGSTALEAAADTVILLTRDAERLTIECKWMKDAPEFPVMALEAVPAAESLVLKPSGVTDGELKGQRALLLHVLHDNSTGDTGLTYRAWHEQTGLASSSFNKARDWLRARTYVRQEGKYWRVTEEGILAMRAVDSTNSTTTPPLHSGASARYSTTPGGSLDPREWSGVAHASPSAFSMPSHGIAQGDGQADAPRRQLHAFFLTLQRDESVDPVMVPLDARTRALELVVRAGPVIGENLRVRCARALRADAIPRTELRGICAELAA